LAEFEAASRYRATLLKMDALRVEGGNNAEQWNRLVDQLQVLHLKLRETPEGRQAITTLIDDENRMVRLWSATNALAWEPERAKDTLKGLAAEGGHGSFEAKITLREFGRGKLKTDWVPKGR
jgi:hypothetical protein